ncbi:MAG TPA: hypothetical protein DCL48_09020, partial [Alphaproteobacteria bacterium]|nr:hypothetical protein [Alphaproteobacteria bacterium]
KALVNGGTRTGSPDGVVMGKPQYSAATGGTGATQGGSLNDRLGVTPSSSDTGYLQGWTPPAEVAAEFRRIQGRMGNPNERATYLNMFDTNGDQHVNENEYYNWWIQNHGIPEGWQGLPNPNGSQPTGGGSPSQPTPSVPGGGGQPPLAQPGVGYSPATMPNNPAQLYNTAAGMTQAAGMSGPNLAAMAGLGPANTYNAAGQAQTGTYNPAGQAAAQGYGVTDAGATGYDAVNAGSQGYTAAGAANVGGYNAQTAGSRGYTADTISDAQRVQISPTANASASRGIQFSQPYENRYTDQVVNTTLNNFDE